MKEKCENCKNCHTHEYGHNSEQNYEHSHEHNNNSEHNHEHSQEHNHNCECHHEHSHGHSHEETEKVEKKDVALYIISLILFAISFIPILKQFQRWICLAVVILAGYDLILEGIKNIFKLNFEEETLMTIAIIAAFILGEYPESCMVVLLFKLGEFLEDKASNLALSGKTK